MAEKSEELLALEKVSTSIEGINKTLGEKANKEEFESVNAAIEEIKKGLETSITDEKLTEKMEEVNTSIKGWETQLEEMAEDLANLKDSNQNGGKRKAVFDPEEVKNLVESYKRQKNGDHTGEVFGSIKMNGAPIFKAAEDMGEPEFFQGASETVNDAFTGRFVDPTLYQRKRKRNLIIDHFPIGSINVPKLVYLEKKEVGSGGASDTDAGGADWIASGGEKPQRSFRVGTGEVEAKKVAIFGTLDDKLIRDVASVENWLREDFTDEMRESYNDALLNNDPGSNALAPLGLKQNAIQYAVTTAFDSVITTPNEIDMIIAAAAYMSTLKEQAGKAFVSSDLWYKIHILKDSNAEYLNNMKVYVNAMGQLFVGGVEIVMADDEDVPATHLLMVSTDPGFKIRNYGPMVFERGLNADDFRKDKTSYRGFQEVLSYIPEHRYNSVLYDTFANIEAAITASS